MPTDDAGEEYTVEALRDWRYNRSQGQREYLVKWDGYSELDNTWEPESYLNCPSLLSNFINSLQGDDCLRFHTKIETTQLGLFIKAPVESCVGTVKCTKKTITRKKHPFVCLVSFADSDQPEQYTPEEVLANSEETLLQFFESRLVYDPTTVLRSKKLQSKKTPKRATSG